MTDKATRHPKTPAQRAQEQVDILTRRLAKITTAKAALEASARDLALYSDVVQKRLTYAQASPDLPAPKQAAPTSSP